MFYVDQLNNRNGVEKTVVTVMLSVYVIHANVNAIISIEIIFNKTISLHAVGEPD